MKPTYKGMNCAVLKCKNYSKITGKEISYHKFPKDKTLKEKWIKSSGRESNFNTNGRYVCSMHFEKDNFQRDLQNELLNLPLRRLLKSGVIPTRNLPVSLIVDNITQPEELDVEHESKRSRMDINTSKNIETTDYDTRLQNSKHENELYRGETESDFCLSFMCSVSHTPLLNL